MVKIIYTTGEVEYVYFFSATLGYSRMHYFEPTKTKTEIDFKRCLINAFKYFGGTTRECLTDNMSCLVSFVNGKRLIHPSVKQFFKDIDVKIIFAKKSTPETKGKCESANRFIKRLKVYNGKIRDFNHLLSITKNLSYRINNEINQSIHVKPIIKFKEEKGTLKPLCNSKLLAWFNNTTLKQEVPTTCLVYYKTKKYSVHPKYIHKTVTFFEDNNVLQIICNNEVIAVHKITEKEINYSEEHYLAAFKKKKFGEDIEEQAKKNLGEFK